MTDKPGEPKSGERDYSQTLFLPQRPYMPIGTLREALWFPVPPALDREAEARAALASGDSSLEESGFKPSVPP